MATRRIAALGAAALATVALAACGSSKPAYCTNRTNLENSVKGLTELNASSGISGLQAQLAKVQSDANALVNSAKGSFPTETSAISSSISALESSVKSLSGTPSASQVATLSGQAAAFANSVKTFVDMTKSKCS